MPSNNVTNRDLYEAVRDLRNELSASIGRVDDKVDRMGNDVTKLKVSDATLSLKVYTLVAIIVLVGSTVVTVVVNKFGDAITTVLAVGKK